MIRVLGGLVAIMMISAIGASPVAAQSRDASKSLTHVLSVTVPARVKVNVSPIAALSTRSVPAAVGVKAASSGLALSVDANRAWVLSVSDSRGSAESRPQWAEGKSGVLVAVVSGAAKSPSLTASGQPLVLTVTTP